MRSLFLFLFLSFSTFLLAQEKVAKIIFLEQKVDFGKIKQGKILNHNFIFVNTGNTPVVISEVTMSCGCVASYYPRQPIMPGDTASVYTKFNSTGKKGKQHKTILIYSNAENSPSKLTFKCNVKDNN